MPPPQADTKRRGGRLLSVLFWGGCALAPLAALLVLLSNGAGALRVAAVLAILAVVLIGLSIMLRPDAGTVQVELQEQLLDEIDILRDDVRQDITTAAHATHRAISERVQALFENVESVRSQLIESTRRQLSDRPAPPTGVARPVPHGTVRHTETVQVTRQTIVDGNGEPSRSTVYGTPASGTVSPPQSPIDYERRPASGPAEYERRPASGPAEYERRPASGPAEYERHPSGAATYGRRPTSDGADYERRPASGAPRSAPGGMPSGGRTGYATERPSSGMAGYPPTSGATAGYDPSSGGGSGRRAERYQSGPTDGDGAGPVYERTERTERSERTERRERVEYSGRRRAADDDPRRGEAAAGRTASGDGYREPDEYPTPWTEQRLRDRVRDTNEWLLRSPSWDGFRHPPEPEPAEEPSWSASSSRDRWASIQHDDRGEELHLAERRASVSGDGGRIRIMDRWAEVRREEAARERRTAGRDLPGQWRDTDRPERAQARALPPAPAEPVSGWTGDWEDVRTQEPVEVSRLQTSRDRAGGFDARLDEGADDGRWRREPRSRSTAPRHNRPDITSDDVRWS